MINGRNTGSKRLALSLTAASVLLVCAASLAQAQTEEEPTAQEQGPEQVAESAEGSDMDEIIVIYKPGDEQEVGTPYEQELRKRVLEEYDRIAREQEELAWRQEAVSEPSRISFGYRPQDQRRDETGSQMNRLPMDRVKPATVFRFEF